MTAKHARALVPPSTRLTILFTICLSALSACRTSSTAPLIPLTPALGSEPAQLSAFCGPFGAPSKTRALGPTHIVIRAGFVLEHSDTRRIPIWVAEHLVASGLMPVPGYRRPKWHADPVLPPEARAEDSDFAALIDLHDRGHLAPAADFGTRELRDATFVLSNAVPQDKENNRRVWALIEKQVRTWALSRKEVWVMTGAFGAQPKHDPHGRIEIPTHLFKVILSVRAGHPEAIAFLVENRTYPEPLILARFVVSIDRIEEETGLDFFPRLPPQLEITLEREPSALWDEQPQAPQAK